MTLTSHPRLTPTIRSRFLEIAQTDLTAARRYLGEQLKVGKSQRNEWAALILKESGLKQTIHAKSENESVTVSELGDEFSADVEVSRAKTLQEVMELVKVDQEKWEPKGFSVTRKKNGFGWNARFSRRPNTALAKGEMEALKADYRAFVKLPVPKIPADNGGDILLEVAIFDLHYGKLCWDEEVGENYDSKIAAKRFLAAVVSLVERAKRQGKINRILFPVGNDFLHVDTGEITTTLGTRQDADSRFSRIFRDGRKLLVEAIEYLKTVAPVDVVVCVGNHDSNSMFHLGDALECWYHADPLVKVENSPVLRKYYRFGNTIIGYTHSDKEKLKDLPLLGSTERKDWSECLFKEWHVGHRHGEHCTEDKGVKVRTLSSMSGSDYWHFGKGYVGNIKGAEAFLFHKESGLLAQLYYNAI